MRKQFVLFLVLVLLGLPRALSAQATVAQYKYDGSSNLSAICEAPQRNVLNRWETEDAGETIAAALELTDIVVLTNTATATFAAAHGLYVGVRITVDSVDIDGVFTVLTVTSTELTFTTVGVSDDTYDSGIVITTNYPREDKPVWRIKRLMYDGSANLIGALWASSISQTFTGTPQNLICADWEDY